MLSFWPGRPFWSAGGRREGRAPTLKGVQNVEVYRTEKKVFGRSHTVVVTFNQNLLDGQMQGLTANLNKARGKLRELQQQLRRWRERKVKGRAPTLKGVQNQVRSICSAQHLKSILKTKVEEVRRGAAQLGVAAGTLAEGGTTQHQPPAGGRQATPMPTLASHSALYLVNSR